MTGANDRRAVTRPATIRQAAVLVGGLGTRLGALASETPKPLLAIGDRPHLAWLLRELCRYGVEEALLLAGHLAARVREAVPALAAALPRPLRLTVIEEPAPAGTGGALRRALPRLDERFILLNGDLLFDTNLAALLAAAAADPPGTLGHLLLRQVDDARRYGVARLAGGRITGFAPSGDSGPALIHGGVAVLSRSVAERCGGTGSLERDVMPALAAAGALRGTVCGGWFIDIGIPADLARARAELPGRLLGRPALILDRDGVLNVDHGYVGTRERLDWIPGARAAVRAACGRGWHVFVATNQSGVARGYFDEDAVRALHAHMAETLRQAGGTVDDWRYCPTHPQGVVAAHVREDDRRKPGPGMLRSLMRAWALDPAGCVMLGDQASDMQAAAAAGIDGVLFCGGDLHAAVTMLLDRRAAATA